MQGLKRRVTYIVFYELLSFSIISTIFFLFSSKDATQSGILAAMTVVLAIIWNFIFNMIFEWWEAKQPDKGRSLKRRIQHAVGFEAGFVAITLPLFAWWLEISLLDAFFLDIGLTLFFMFFTFFYSWAFDKIFGLPLSAQYSA